MAKGIGIALAEFQSYGGVETALDTAASAKGYMNINTSHNRWQSYEKSREMQKENSFFFCISET